MENLLASWKTTARIILDVRPEVEDNGEPYVCMLEAARIIKPGELLVIIAPFEPIPLYAALHPQGFRYAAQQATNGEWIVRLYRRTW